MCVLIIANLSRHAEKAVNLVFNVDGLVPTLVEGMKSASSEIRENACYAIQNFSCNEKCSAHLCSHQGLIEALSRCASHDHHHKEQKAALYSIRNFLQGSENFIHFMGTDGPMEYLMQTASLSCDDFSGSDELRCLIRDVLEIISNCMLSSATMGSNNQGSQECSILPFFRPTLRVLDWNQWK